MTANYEKKNTIIVAASSFATSNPLGGHYRSAAAIAALLSRDYDVILLNTGAKPSPVMRADGVETYFFEGCPERPSHLRNLIATLLDSREVRCVLAFDQKVGELVRPLARRMKIGLVLVKAGGGLPRIYYPKVTYNIAFMSADKLWLEERNAPQGRVIQAAGRVYKPPQDLAAQAALRAEINLRENDLAIVRIGRIASHYSAVNRAALALGAKLRKSGLSARVIIIGTPDDAEEYSALLALSAQEDAIICDNRYTDRASKLLDMFRFSVGTGRGFMEAASMGHMMFCATQDPTHDLPLLVNEDNFQRFFDDNFAPRIKPDVDRDTNLTRTFEAMQNLKIQNTLREAAYGWYEKYFSAENSRRRYIDVIEESIHNPERFGLDHVLSEIHLRLSTAQDHLRRRFVG